MGKADASMSCNKGYTRRHRGLPSSRSGVEEVRKGFPEDLALKLGPESANVSSVCGESPNDCQF